MSDQVDAGPSPQEPGEQQTQADWFLLTLISQVNTFDYGVGITLYVGGIIVSGRLVSGKRFFEKWAADFGQAMSRAMGEDVTATIAAPYRAIAEDYASREAKAVEGAGEEESAEGSEPPIGFVHLENAHAFLPGANPIPGGEGTMWRGRVSSVDGFHLGELAPS